MSALAESFLTYSRQKLVDYRAQIERCALLLAPSELWHRANDHSNSVGNLLLHLRGNVMMWIVAGLGGKPFDRDRPAEFAQRDPLPLEPMLANLADALAQADTVIAAMTPADLERRYQIQKYDVTGLEAVYHVVEHFALHTGQIITMTKAIKNCDLSVYDAQGHRRDSRKSGAP